MSSTSLKRAALIPPFALLCLSVHADSWANPHELDQNRQN